MRTITRTLVGVATAAGIAAGGVAAAGTGFAATQPAATAAVSAQDVSVLAEENLGLDEQRAKNWQCWLRDAGYDPGEIDGKLGTSSWTAAQRYFNLLGLDAGEVDGKVGPDTISALQRYLNSVGDYNLAVDGDAGEATRAAFWDFNGKTGC
ncbi:peptidoglycan-binding domain-containing protein [Streptomyces sp. DG2A-72]|uniref:peptidoglycan-binding domain-containing protein n=1 Tax=Streptomyces sp. DG2A-72 TaxID=3051386 RepID=UPI00265C6B0C|nr:peptidoglycan-binding domain-containing protein [Streptomyces sp. DG2A-72]MDO0930780.1 peptidoglycan-binding domain-containing protein [Streptomyces sp. DG2A-72]